MHNGFLTHWAAKNRRNKLKWRIASAMLAGIALLFAFQGFSRAEDDHKANAITSQTFDCSKATFIIRDPGRYFLASDLNNCQDIAISITASDVKLELRGHTIQGAIPSPSTLTVSSLISVSANVVGVELSNIEIAGPGTVTGGNTGIDFENVHHSRVHNLVVVGNTGDGITVNATSSTNASTAPTDDKSHDNEFYENVVTSNGNNANNGITVTGGTNDEFRDNVVTANAGDGIQLNGGNENRFIHNDLSGNFLNGLNLINATHNVVRRNTADANSIYGIVVVEPLSSDNTIENNTALGNFGGFGSPNDGPDLKELNGAVTATCPLPNTWSNNSFNTSDPTCIH